MSIRPKVHDPSPRRAGHPPKPACKVIAAADEIERENARLRAKLKHAEYIIEIQKTLADLESPAQPQRDGT